MDDKRIIPIPDLNLGSVDYRDVNESDKELLSKIRKDFLKSGYLHEEYDFTEGFDMSDAAIEEKLDDSNNIALSEKDFNKDFYDEDLDGYLKELDKSNLSMENPLIEDYDVEE